MDHQKSNISRREFLRRIGIGAGSALAMSVAEPLKAFADNKEQQQANNRMTYRVQHGSGEQISLLGFGMMRLPDNQDEVNTLVDYALAHGVNYFDTAPMYHGGRNERQTGDALKRHPRNSYYIATKLSTTHERLWSEEASKAMYYKSFEELQTDYIDYYLLHNVGNGGYEQIKKRFLDNGILDFLLKEREAGRIKHLGFSYHGDVSGFDWLVDHHDDYHWDFVQIQMNYLDWQHASMNKSGWKRDADAEYLYNKLDKLGIQVIIMEPLRGGSLARLRDDMDRQLHQQRPDDPAANWAFRWAASFPNVLTVLSGMNRMDHLEENIRTFSPLETCTEQEKTLLSDIANQMAGVPTIPCTTCRYCMPCPYGVDIPLNFSVYNEAVNQGILPLPAPTDSQYAQRQQQFAAIYREKLPDEKTWAHRCEDCEACMSHCPQQIRIPNQLSRIVQTLRKNKSI